jgi:hypothetical protein
MFVPFIMTGLDIESTNDFFCIASLSNEIDFGFGLVLLFFSCISQESNSKKVDKISMILLDFLFI